MRAMAKHSFNADDEAEEILLLAERALRDKTEFLNRLINKHGRQVIHTIMTERQKAVADALHEPHGTYHSATPDSAPNPKQAKRRSGL